MGKRRTFLSVVKNDILYTRPLLKNQNAYRCPQRKDYGFTKRRLFEVYHSNCFFNDCPGLRFCAFNRQFRADPRSFGRPES